MPLYDRMPAHRADSVPAGLLGTETTGKIGVAAGRNVPPANGQPLFGRQAQEGEREHPPVGNDLPFSPRQHWQATRIGCRPEPGHPEQPFLLGGQPAAKRHRNRPAKGGQPFARQGRKTADPDRLMEMGGRGHCRRRGNRGTPQDRQALAFGDRDVFLFFEDVLVGRADDAFAVEVQLFDAVGGPSDDTCHREQRRIDFLRQSDHFIHEAGIEIDVRGNAFLRPFMLGETFDGT